VVSVSDLSLGEGTGPSATTGSVLVSLSAPSGRAVSVPWTVAAGTAKAADLSLGSGTVTIPAGDTTASIPVSVVADALDEDDETASVTLGTPTNATKGTGSATLTVLDDDGAPTVSIADTSAVEGTGGAAQSQAQVTVTLGGPSGRTVTVPWSTTPGTASSADFTAGSGTLTIPAGSTSTTLTVPVAPDALDEDDETVLVVLGTPTNASLSDGDGVLTILDDDAAPVASLVDSSVTEGNSGSADAAVTVVLSGASGRAVQVGWATTTGGTATPGSDYTARSGTVSLPAGETSATFAVPVLGDTVDEPDETVRLVLSSPQNATVSAPNGTLTILDDDAAPADTTASVYDVAAFEGSAGSPSRLAFFLALSRPAPRPMTVAWSTVNGSAVAGTDFAAASGKVSFAAGQRSAKVSVTARGNGTRESDKSFTLALSGPTGGLAVRDGVATGTVLDDDTAGVRVAFGNCLVEEPDTNTKACSVPLLLSRTTSRTVSVSWRTMDGTATSGSPDYVAANRTVKLSRSGSVSTGVAGDRRAEPPEYFRVRAYDSAGATIATSPGLVVIVDNDTR
jgi:hypothetical protein